MKFLMIFMATAFLLFSSCKPSTDSDATAEEAGKVDMAQVKAEIQEMETAWGKAQSAKDVTTLMSFYADDAISMPDGEPTLTGKAAIQKKTEENFAGAADGLTHTYTVFEVFGDGETVTEIGTGVTKDAEGKELRTGKYIAVWQKTDGKYLCIREIYNSDTPAK